MDTMGALALGTELPTTSALLRKPYKRTASLISRPMRRNILCQSAFQLTLLFVLLFKGADMFGVRPIGEDHCLSYFVGKDSQMWDTNTRQKSLTGTAGCTNFASYCPDKDDECLRSLQRDTLTQVDFTFSDLEGFTESCLDCRKKDYIHGTIIFNAFIFCQVKTLIHLISSHLFYSILVSFILFFSCPFSSLLYSTLPSFLILFQSLLCFLFSFFEMFHVSFLLLFCSVI